jgi:hypothetical protein
MKIAVWVLGLLLGIDALVFAYFSIFGAFYYYPDRYEYAFAATFYCFIVGLPILIAFAFVFARYRKLQKLNAKK